MPHPDLSARVATDLRGRSQLQRPDLGGVELSHLGRYLLIALVIAGTMIVGAWSRVDLRGTAVALGETERRLATAEANEARLQLELATLRAPARLRGQQESLGLTENVTVIDLTRASQP